MAAQELRGKLRLLRVHEEGISAHPTWCLWQREQPAPYRCCSSSRGRPGARIQSRTRSRRAWERKGRGNERKRERVSEHRLISIYLPQTSFYVVIHRTEDVLVVGGGTAAHHARRLLKTFSGRLNALHLSVCFQHLQMENCDCQWMKDGFNTHWSCLFQARGMA